MHRAPLARLRRKLRGDTYLSLEAGSDYIPRARMQPDDIILCFANGHQGQYRTHHLKYLRALLRFVKQHTPDVACIVQRRNFKFKVDDVSDASMSSTAEGRELSGYLLLRQNGDISSAFFRCTQNLRSVSRSSSTT